MILPFIVIVLLGWFVGAESYLEHLKRLEGMVDENS